MRRRKYGNKNITFLQQGIPSYGIFPFPTLVVYSFLHNNITSHIGGGPASFQEVSRTKEMQDVVCNINIALWHNGDTLLFLYM